jgi:hypothetical protein
MLVRQAAAGFAGIRVDRWRDMRDCDWLCLLQGHGRERPKKAAGRFEVAMLVLSWKGSRDRGAKPTCQTPRRLNKI